MSVEENKGLIRRCFEEFNKGEANLMAAMALIDELYATDIVRHRSTGEDIRGIENYKQLISKTASNDFHATIEDMVAEGDKVAVRWTFTGTHKGEMMGIPPTNKKVTMWLIQIDRVVGGKIVERWTREDTLGFMQQLGVIPMPQKEK